MKNMIYTLAIAILLTSGCNSSTGPAGDDSRITEDPVLATVGTLPVMDLGMHNALGEGRIHRDGGSSVTERGLVWSLNPNPTLADNRNIHGKGTGRFRSLMEDLLPDQIYFARAYAINATGTAYGEELQFRTRQGTVTDIDGNVYYTQTIGEDIWMAENLRVTRYKNGDPIQTGLNGEDWEFTLDGAYSIFPHSHIYLLDSEAEVAEAYGLLYNWFAVNDPRGVCPEGWRVSNNDDWERLIQLVGDQNDDGKLKSRRVDPDPHPRWESPNVATDLSGWSGLPGGRRLWDGRYVGFGSHGHWHSATERDSYHSFSKILFHASEVVFRNYNSKLQGSSIRCVRDM